MLTDHVVCISAVIKALYSREQPRDGAKGENVILKQSRAGFRVGGERLWRGRGARDVPVDERTSQGRGGEPLRWTGQRPIGIQEGGHFTILPFQKPFAFFWKGKCLK